MTDSANAAGRLAVRHVFQQTCSPLSLLTFLFLCAGVHGPTGNPSRPLVRTSSPNLASRCRHIESLWERATRDDLEARLRRRIVEIRDVMIDGSVEFATTNAEKTLFEATE